jgi:hypothetical protein
VQIVIENIPRENLDNWYLWLTIFAIGLPIVGALMGGICGWGAFIVGTRIGDLQSAEIEQLQPWHLSSDQRGPLTNALADRLRPGE